MVSYEETRMAEINARNTEAEARKVEALVKLAEKPPTFRATIALAVSEWTGAMWITLWVSQVLLWGFLMMTFKKDVWPH